MAWEKDRTRLVHRIFEPGVFAGYEGQTILVNFDSAGIKKLSGQVIVNGLLNVDKEAERKRKREAMVMTNIKQFNTSEIVVSGKNIAESEEYTVPLYFNESYTVAGDITAPSIYACYNLTILGDVTADLIEVKGDLFVLGHVKSKHVQCGKNIICKGNVSSEKVFAGNNLIANSVKCNAMRCSGNILLQSIAEVEQSVQSEGMLVAGEGVIGQGELLTSNVITGEYFDFEGSIGGKVVDLGEEGFEYSPTLSKESDKNSEMLLSELCSAIDEDIKEAGQIDEDSLRDLVRKISEMDAKSWNEWNYVLSNIIDISYMTSITNLKDYLIVVYADRMLPESIKTYETIDHVFQRLLPDARKQCSELSYKAKDTREFAFSIHVVDKCSDCMDIEIDEVLDRVFQSVGIKYSTVKYFFNL